MSSVTGKNPGVAANVRTVVQVEPSQYWKSMVSSSGSSQGPGTRGDTPTAGALMEKETVPPFAMSRGIVVALRTPFPVNAKAKGPLANPQTFDSCAPR